MGIDGLTDDFLESRAIAACFAAPAMLRHMLEFEAALAQAEADLGIIPAAAAVHIAACAAADDFDIAAIRRETAASGSAAIPLVALLTTRVAARDTQAAAYVHWGSTSQDVMDSAMMLACRAAATLLATRLAAIGESLAALIVDHRHTPMVARTLAQHAGPTSFGLKLAAWAQSLCAGAERLRETEARLPLQFGGASGTLAAFGAQGLAVAAAVGDRLGLRAAPPWHTERSSVRELAAALAELGAGVGKIATDIVLLAQNEIGELRERSAPGRGGSSAMPHKRNPVAAIAAVAAARRVPGLLATVYGAFDHWNERAAGAWHAEQRALAELCTAVGASLEKLDESLVGLEVDVAAMQRNLASTRGLGMADAVAMALTPALGRPHAQALVEQACASATERELGFDEVLAGIPEVTAVLGPAALAQALDPHRPSGIADGLIDLALARLEHSLRGRPAAIDWRTSENG